MNPTVLDQIVRQQEEIESLRQAEMNPLDQIVRQQEEIESLREQLAAALAAIKVKDEAMRGALYSGSPYTTAFENALAIKPIDIDGLKMSNEFKREPRYVVFKIKDIHAYLPPHLVEAIKAAGETIAVGRALEKRPPFNAVVVEQDWPEFEMVWAAIEARMGEQK